MSVSNPSKSSIPTVTDVSNLFPVLALIPSRNKAFIKLSEFLGNFGVNSCCFFETSKGFLPDEPMILYSDSTDNGFGQSWIENYGMKQFAKVDLALRKLIDIPVWENVNKIRSVDTQNRKITSEMSLYNLNESIVSSYITPSGTIGAIILCSIHDALFTWPSDITGLIAELCKIVITKQPTRRDNKNKNIWPKPNTKSYMAYKILAHGGSDQELRDTLSIEQRTAEWHVKQCKQFLSRVYLRGEYEVTSRGEIAGILYPILGDKWEMYK